jgi:signal peptidase I
MIKMSDMEPLIRDTLDKGLTFSFPSKGISMMPLIHSGDIVTLDRVKTPIKKGDIILYKRPISNAYVLHRVRKVCKDNTICCVGDHQYRVEKMISQSDVIAILISFKRKDSNKEYNLKSKRYKFYKFLVRIGIVRLFFRWLF